MPRLEPIVLENGATPMLFCNNVVIAFQGAGQVQPFVVWDVKYSKTTGQYNCENGSYHSDYHAAYTKFRVRTQNAPLGPHCVPTAIDEVELNQKQAEALDAALAQEPVDIKVRDLPSRRA